MVAAWMAHPEAANGALFATVARPDGSHYLALSIMVDVRNRVICRWSCSTGGSAYASFEGIDGRQLRSPFARHLSPLPTLPARLYEVPPVVALLLSLYDVPEIRAQVEAL
jgi:hypothetical protein